METKPEEFTKKSIDDEIINEIDEDAEKCLESAESSQNVDVSTNLIKKIFDLRCPYFGYSRNMSFQFANSSIMSAENWLKFCNETDLMSPLISLTYNINEIYQTNPDILELKSDELLTQECLSGEQDESGKSFDDILSDEQKDFVTFIEKEIKSMLLANNVQAKCILLTGYAGTGKTSILKSIRNIEKTNILYLANTKSLCASVGVKYKINTMNIFLFFMRILNLNHDETSCLVQDPDNDNKAIINSYFFTEMFPQKGVVHIIFFDEFSMFAPHNLKQFLSILKKPSNELQENFLIILCGDFMHIPPLYSESNDYEQIIDMCDKKYNFKQQLRIRDVNYLNTIMKLTYEPLLNSQKFLNELKTIIPENCFSSLIEYTFPFDYIWEHYLKLNESLDLQAWLNKLEADFFSKVLNLKAFAYENLEVHYMNLNLVFTIIHQMCERGISLEDIRSLVYLAKFGNTIPAELPINQWKLAILPLIRFFPYRILIKTANVSSGSILYLIKWDIKARNVTMYHPYYKQLLVLNFQCFYMNLYPDQQIYGIPLELAFANTFHKTQGETITEDIAVSLSNIDYRELFAILSRINSAKQIKNLYTTLMNV